MSTIQETSGADPHFAFGKNWEQFARNYFSEERVQASKRRILDFLQVEDLTGKYFLDVGCGSGLSSLAAFDAGAKRVVSFDVDLDSVKTTQGLHGFRGSPQNWEIFQGSVLDHSFLSMITPADIVYSWGVLHHTGRMWEAIRNAASLLKAGSLFYIALYLTTPKSGYWLETKKRYNKATEWRKRMMEGHYVVRHMLIPKLIRGQNPFRAIRSWKHHRGMAFIPDVRDWLGGYPYEDAGIAETLRFCHRELGLNLININPGTGMAEYLFHKPSR